jgi:hypothetical protein
MKPSQVVGELFLRMEARAERKWNANPRNATDPLRVHPKREADHVNDPCVSQSEFSSLKLHPLNATIAR